MKSNHQVLSFQVAARPTEPRGAVLASAIVMALVTAGRWAAAHLANRKPAASAPVTVSAALR